MNKTNIFILIGHLVSLMFGVWIYILFRQVPLKIYSWIDNTDIMYYINFLQQKSKVHINQVPEWIIYSLPDGLWVFSYVCLSLIIWKREITSINLIWILILPIIGISMEIFQFFGIINGTADFYDLIFYIIGAVSPFVIFNKLLNFKILVNEKLS